jgi:hypothetical protein
MFVDSQACFFATEIIRSTLLLVIFTTPISALHMYCYANVKIYFALWKSCGKHAYSKSSVNKRAVRLYWTQALQARCVNSSMVVEAEQLTGTVTTTNTGNPSISLPLSTDCPANSHRATQTNTISLSTAATVFTTTTSTITSYPTSTIPTVAGFTPIASDASYVAKKRDIPERFSLDQRATSQLVKSIKLGSNKKATYSPAAYPQSVKCVKYQKEVVTKTITIPFCTKTKTTTLATSTSTIRETVSTITTITEVPPAATITESASTTVTVETSTTSTQTNTEAATGNASRPTPTHSRTCN